MDSVLFHVRELRVVLLSCALLAYIFCGQAPSTTAIERADVALGRGAHSGGGGGGGADVSATVLVESRRVLDELAMRGADAQRIHVAERYCDADFLCFSETIIKKEFQVNQFSNKLKCLRKILQFLKKKK